MVYLYTELEEFNLLNFEQAFNLMTEERRNRINRYKYFIDKKMSMIAFLLLKKASYDITKNKEMSLEFDYGNYGKPFLKNYNDIKFNISHCKNGVVCAVSKYDVGIDIQNIVKVDNDFLQLTMSKNELVNILNSKDPNEKAIKFWTLKESYLKFLGTGLVDSLNSIDFAEYDKSNKNEFHLENKYFITQRVNNMVLSTCSLEKLNIIHLSKDELLNILV